jgi:hypothetical protein
LEFSQNFLCKSLILKEGSAKLQGTGDIIFLGCRVAHLGCGIAQ